MSGFPTVWKYCLLNITWFMCGMSVAMAIMCHCDGENQMRNMFIVRSVLLGMTGILMTILLV